MVDLFILGWNNHVHYLFPKAQVYNLYGWLIEPIDAWILCELVSVMYLIKLILEVSAQLCNGFLHASDTFAVIHPPMMQKFSVASAFVDFSSYNCRIDLD